jgi:hypothetical protein
LKFTIEFAALCLFVTLGVEIESDGLNAFGMKAQIDRARVAQATHE